jgi:SAM-dependent methyltransferase
MTRWLPAFACPRCGVAVVPGGTAVVSCRRCGRKYRQQSGIWDFLLEGSRARLDAFARQYRAVREREGRRSGSPGYYRDLPNVDSRDPHAAEWRVRSETYRHLLRHVLATGPQPSTILDLGAGSGWLAHRLARLGHKVVAVDALDDDADGLGAVRHYEMPIVALRADFDALPLLPGQFEVVIFNGSLHYAPDVAASLAHARSMLVPGGTLAVMDSPMFRTGGDGNAMIAGNLCRFATAYGLNDVVQAGTGYLTFASLESHAGALQMQSQFVPSRGPLRWRLQRRLSGIRLGRQPAAFGLWVAR